MNLNELKESIEDLLENYPEAGDMRVCFYDSASQYSHQLWGPEIKYLADGYNSSEELYESVDDAELNELSSADVEAVVIL